MRAHARDWALSGLIFGLLIAAVFVAWWLAMAALVMVADKVGPTPFAIFVGFALSRHRRSCEARGERKQRAPTAHLR